MRLFYFNTQLAVRDQIFKFKSFDVALFEYCLLLKIENTVAK